MSFAISLSNLKHNKKLYQVYFLAQLVIFSLFFMLQCFSTDSVIVARLAEDADIKTMIQTISLFFVLFIVFYFVYFNQFFIKQRAEETPAARPPRSSRTKGGSPQTSCARAG